ncbi:MAG: bifunctional GTP diphosphokinase/guanosine-3',5'-bis pyrophosphate 3'-pyrophosphohydrolase [Gammaproteobacteria bacterium]
MGFFAKLKTKLKTYLDDHHIKLIYQAYMLAKKAHHGQRRRTGDPYITHPVAVACILADMRMDYQSIMAALLHDVLEDTPMTKHMLAEKFGESVAELVDGVSKLTQIDFKSRMEAQAENFRKMVLAMARDIRVILVKLADRLHNMRTIKVMPLSKRARIAAETLDIYAPIANRLGMHAFRIEFEDLAFEALHPMRFRVLGKAVEKARGNRKEIIGVIEKAINNALQEHGITGATIYGRKKHLYGIYLKMRNKQLSFNEIMDVYAFRIIVDTIDTCYRVVGVVHNLYKPLAERFKDYIAIPKANGYQSLHTTLFGPYGVPIEIQIRTQAMHQVAENGIASHWLYKSGAVPVDEAQIRAQQWLKNLLEMQKSTGNSIEFIENVKVDLFPDELYVFTPKGDILELPRGSTPVDFAYSIHSDIGNSCVAAKIDRRLAPLSEALQNGQNVEIITAHGARPNPAWLNFVVTGKARSGIRHFLKMQQHSESIQLGKQLLNKALMYFSKDLHQISREEVLKIAHEFHYKTTDDLFENIGLGNQVALVIARRLAHLKVDEDVTEEELVGRDKEHPLVVSGTEGMVVNFAACCRPIPGDPIVGCLTAGRGVDVHVERCKHVSDFRSQPERFISMRWQDNIKGEFKIDVVLYVVNQRNVLVQIAGAIADSQANIEAVSVEPHDGRHVRIFLTLTVIDRKHLAKIMRRLRLVKQVVRIVRKFT